ncbi:MAG TPA: endonuclease/exonuclease/phosphatase family protein, partial [Flavobacteriales bacterium]|nr:endonuclease/exonuclease/phosphatase family protein [Flavobacteriales bacterium]
MVDGRAVRLFAVHATSPGSFGHFRRRNEQLKALAEIVRNSGAPTFVIGDLNTVHWDGAYQRFCARSGMRPINSPFTITWPSVGPFALIPLDHALVSAEVDPSVLRSFNVSGSDHRGLYAELHFDNAR